MKKTMVQIPFDEEKLAAAKLYMEQKGLSFEEELVKATETLYGKYVPANVREFLELSSGTKHAAKPRRPRPSPSSAVGVPNEPGGDPD